MISLSKNLLYKEAVFSPTALRRGIDNNPPDNKLPAMKNLSVNLFQPLRDHFGVPIHVNSFYRSPELNKAIGGSSKSDHMILDNMTAAIDIDDVYSRRHGIYNADLFYHIATYMKFYKLIWEFNESIGVNNNPRWIHISYSLNQELNDKKIIMKTLDGKNYIKI
jgi:hypothetical protein